MTERKWAEKYESLYCGRGLLPICGRRCFRLDQQSDQIFSECRIYIAGNCGEQILQGKFVYELPENLTQVYEVYLDDCEWESGNRKRKSLRQVHLSHKEYDEMLNMVLNRRTDWGVIFDLFHRKHLSVDDFLMGRISSGLPGSAMTVIIQILISRISSGRCAPFICRCSGH